MQTYKLHLIRHGFTQANLDGIYMGGGLDLPLCEDGKKALIKMKEMYEYPKVGVLFSSPLKRALETAEILYPFMENKIILQQLRENNFGEFEGRKIDDLKKDSNFFKWLDPTSQYVPNGGESGKDFSLRTSNALFEMLEYLAKNNITQGACICHGGVIMSMLAKHGFPEKKHEEWLCDNGAGFTVCASTAMIMRDKKVEVLAIVPKEWV